MESKAEARAKEAKTKESVTTVEQLDTSQEYARAQGKARAKAMDFKDNATTAERWIIRLGDAPRTKEMQKGPGAREDTKEPGAKGDPKGRAKASGKMMEMKPKETLSGTSRRTKNQGASVR